MSDLRGTMSTARRRRAPTRRGWMCLVCLAVSLVRVEAGGAATRAPALVEAVRAGDVAAVRTLLGGGADADARSQDGATALHWAAHLDDLETAALLLAAGADVDAGNDYGVTPLALACLNGSAAMTRALLDAGADPDLAQMTGETPLMTAARTGRLDVVEALLAAGAGVEAAEPTHGQTALMWAVSERQAPVVRALIAAGANVEARSTDGFSPLLFAAREGDADSARTLVEAGADVNGAASSGMSPLLVATVRGHTAVALLLLGAGADPNTAEAGYTPLHWAVGSWETELTGPRGIVTDRDEEWRALRGVPTRRTELIAALLAHGGDPNMPLERPPRRVGFSTSFPGRMVGGTPLWLAARAADTTTIRLLADAGADPLIPAEDGTTALMAAAGVGRNLAESLVSAEDALAATRLLAELGGDVNAVNAAGDTALHGAAHVRADALVRFLADRGAMLSVANERGETPLIVAERYIQPGAAPVVRRTSTGDLLRALGAR